MFYRSVRRQVSRCYEVIPGMELYLVYLRLKIPEYEVILCPYCKSNQFDDGVEEGISKLKTLNKREDDKLRAVRATLE